MAVSDDDRLVTIASVYRRSELYALAGLLRANGIFVSTVGEGHCRVHWGIIVALGGVRVQVKPTDWPLARELLAGIDRSPFRGGVFCRPRWLDIALMLVLFFPFGVPPPPRLPADFHFARARAGG
jgi:hypothetical protein